MYRKQKNVDFVYDTGNIYMQNNLILQTFYIYK